MEKFKEKKIVIISDIIIVIMFIAFLISLFCMIFTGKGNIGFLFLPLGIPFIVIGQLCSNRNEYSRQFLAYMKAKLNKAITLEELKTIEIEFNKLAIENDKFILSFPNTLRIIQLEILSKINILLKQKII